MNNVQTKRPQTWWIRVVGATLVAISGMLVFSILLGLIAKTNNVVTTVPEDYSIIIPAITPTETPEFITVEYQLEIDDIYGVVPVEFWFTDDEDGGNEVSSQTISIGKPFTTTVQIPSGNHVETAGVVDVERFDGKITCRILIAGTPIAQNTKSGDGAAVHCSGIVFSD